MPFGELTPERAHDALLAAGVSVGSGSLHVEARDECWIVRLPQWRMAWFAANEAGQRRLETEGRVLRLLEARCTFRAPRVLLESAEGDLQIRALVQGVTEPWSVYAALRNDLALATGLGAAIGRLLAEQHTRIHADDAAGWLPRKLAWPLASDAIAERVVRVSGDPELGARAQAVFAAYDSESRLEHDRVLVHGDLGLHNLVVDVASASVEGVFDYADAAWVDRHHDFRYLVFDFEPHALFDAACASYQAEVGRRVDRQRVFLDNAACALTFLAERLGTPPDERSCGRTLAEDLRWSRLAVARVLNPRA